MPLFFAIYRCLSYLLVFHITYGILAALNDEAVERYALVLGYFRHFIKQRFRYAEGSVYYLLGLAYFKHIITAQFNYICKKQFFKTKESAQSVAVI